MGRKIYVGICILIIIVLGILAGIYLYDINNVSKDNFNNETIQVEDLNNNIEVTNTLEVVNQEEKTTPNTLMIYKIYYTKCNHYINEYKDIDISAVNLTEEEIKDKNKDWKIEEFSEKQIVFEREEEAFCDQHFKLKLVNDNVIIYKIDENNNEIEYQTTDITSEFLTNEDILKLKQGILVYGRENLTAVLEDYE